MKTIIVYSGKGGVGKTTTTVNIARLLLEMGKSVYLLDADVNTPSVHKIFPKDSSKPDGLTVRSVGYDFDGLVYLQDSLIRKFINNAIKEINKIEPDYVLIDTPPSITDVHINLIDRLNVSGILAVTQPTQLSVADVTRTIGFFSMRKMYIIGLVQNMVGEELGEAVQFDGIETVAKIPMSKTYNDSNVLTSSLEPYRGLFHLLENLDDVKQEIVRRQLLSDEAIAVTEDNIQDEWDATPYKKRKLADLRFHNVKTWDYVRERLADMPIIFNDKFLDVNTPDRIERMLEAFEEDKEAFFMVTNAPNTGVPLFPGEIGKATLVLNRDSHYGVPRISYSTSFGEVILFPHEVKPVGMDLIAQLIADQGYTLLNDGRYMPSEEVLEEIYHTFGHHVGMYSNWKETYDKVL